ncbi:hypothetical protein BRN08_06690, partial [Xanthomonas oryzae pv. oryzae]
MCAAGLAALGLARQVQMIEHQTSKFDRSIMTSPISITTLAALASAGVLRTVQLVGQVGGYTVMVRVGQTEKQLT